MKKSLLTLLILAGLAENRLAQASWLTVGLGSVGALVSAKLYRNSLGGPYYGLGDYEYITISIPSLGKKLAKIELPEILCAMLEGKAEIEHSKNLTPPEAEYLLSNTLIKVHDDTANVMGAQVVGWKIIVEEDDSFFHGFGTQKVMLLCKRLPSKLTSIMYGAATIASLGLVGYSLYNR
jgi:hypothetical protein